MALVQNLDDVLNLFLRRKKVIFAVALICTLFSVWAITNQKKVYPAYAAIQVEGARVQTGSGADEVNNSAQIMQSIENRLLTRENLLLMIDRHGLAANEPGKSSLELVSDLRKAINIETVADASASFGQSGISAIIIRISTGDPELSARLANDLAQSILDLSNEGTTSRARDTYTFFEAEEKRLRTEIVDKESELSAFQNKNADSLPVLTEGRRTELQELDAELRDLERQLLEATSEKSRLETQGVQRETDRRRLDEVTQAMSLLSEKQAFAQTRRDQVQASLAAMPEVEQTIAALTRELALLQDRYGAVSQNLADAQTSLSLAERQQSQRFSLLDRAITPEYASGIGYRKLIVAAALGSLLVGFLAAIAVELAFPIVRTSAQLERAMGVSAIGTIPQVRGLERRTRPQSRTEFYLWNLFAIIVATAVFLLVSSGIR